MGSLYSRATRGKLSLCDRSSDGGLRFDALTTQVQDLGMEQIARL